MPMVYMEAAILVPIALVRVAYGVCLHSLCSLPLFGYDRIFYIHKVLGQMDEFNHGLRLFLVKLVD